MDPITIRLQPVLSEIRRNLSGSEPLVVVGSPEDRARLALELPNVVSSLPTEARPSPLVLVAEAEALASEPLPPDALRFELRPAPAPTRFHDVLGWLRPGFANDLDGLRRRVSSRGSPRDRVLLASAAARVGALREARSLLVDQDPSSFDGEDRVRALLLLATAGYELGLSVEAAAALDELRPLLDAAELENLPLAARLYRLRGEAAFAWALAREGLSRAQGRPRAEAGLWGTLGWMYSVQHSWSESQPAFARSAALFLEVDEPGPAAIMLEVEASQWSAAGRSERARRVLGEAIERARQAGDDGVEAICLARVAHLARQEGRKGRSATLLQTAMALSEQGTEPYVRARVRHEASMICGLDRALDDMETLLASALAIFREVESARMQATCLLGLGNLCVLRGDLLRAWGYVVAAYHADRMVHDLDLSADVLSLLCTFAHGGGDLQTAVLAGGRALALFERLDRPADVLEVLTHLHDALWRLGRSTGAAAAALLATRHAEGGSAEARQLWEQRLAVAGEALVEPWRAPGAEAQARGALQREIDAVVRELGRDPLQMIPLKDDVEGEV